MQGPQVGMGPVWLQNPESKFRKCDEFHTAPCDPEPTDTCCAVVSCVYCLTWTYGGEIKNGVAKFVVNSWVGVVDNRSFVAYWERNPYTNECEFVVTLDEVEIARLGCYDVSCRESDYGVEVILEDASTATLEWNRHEFHTIPYAKTEEGCTDFFCGNCECTCFEMCVKIKAVINDDQDVFFLEGEGDIPLISYPCDAPEWAGVVHTTLSALEEDIDVNVYLYRDPYNGDCMIAGTARGQELEPKRVIDCKIASGTWRLYDGSIVQVKCKICDCKSQACEFCCLPMDFSSPLYPAGRIRDIPFEVTCGEDTFTDKAFATSPANLPCTEEVSFYGFDWSPPEQKMYIEGILPDGSCPSTPCSNTFRFLLECTARFSEPGDDNGCDRIWLWIGSTNLLVGDIGEVPHTSGGFVGINSWIRVAPSSCTCDEVEGLAAIFEFDITIDCSYAGHLGIPYGPCDGIVLDCCFWSCSGTLMI